MDTRFTSKQWRLLTFPCCLVMLSALLFALCGRGMVYAASSMDHVSFNDHQSHYVPAPPDSGMMTVHNDNQRTGQDLNETVLTTSNVKASTFGRRVTYAVDGQVYAQPLFMPNVLINGQLHNVVYVATEHDSIYAFDADQTDAVGGLLWVDKYGSSATSTPVPTDDLFTRYRDIDPQVGITGTPVIDPMTGTLYVVTMTREGTAPRYRYVQRLHALDIVNGLEKFNGPIEIQANIAGKGAGSVHGRIAFNARIQNQRPGLLLLNGVVYIAWASFGDGGPYHGWIIGYNAQTLQQVAVYNTTPNGSRAGIWMSGDGLSVDDDGYIYASTGNGTFDLNKGGKDAGDSVIKLDPRHNLSLVDYFTPFNQACLEKGDGDMGSSGILLFPSQIASNTTHNNLFVEGKEGRGYLLSQDHMGRYANVPNLVCGRTSDPRINIDHIVQEFPLRAIPPIYGSAAYYAGTATSGQYMYVGGVNAPLKAYRYNQHNDGKLAATPSSQSRVSFNYPGVSPVVSADGSVPGTGIVWIISRRACHTASCPASPNGVLSAYDATNLNRLLYTSDDNIKRDYLSNFVKFSAPTIANGHVFVGDGQSLKIYGLLSDS